MDDEYSFSLEDEIIVKNKLKLEQTLTEKEIEDLKLQDGKLTAFDKALKILERSIKTEKAIRDYLKEKEYLKQTIDETIKKLKSYGYIDDSVYAENYIRTYISSKGKRKIKYELLTKGVSEKIADQKLEENIDEDIEIENCQKLAKKYLKNKEINLKTRQKLYSHLTSKGFDFDVIKRACKDLLKEESNESWD